MELLSPDGERIPMTTQERRNWRVPGKNQKGHVINCMPHPNRTQQYAVHAEVWKHKHGWNGIFEGWPTIHFTRHLSNVGRAIRQEIGERFWKRITIRLTEEYTSLSWELLAFLQERPAIHRGIKSLYLYVSLMKDSTFQDTPNQFITTCEYISKNLQLETFKLHF